MRKYEMKSETVVKKHEPGDIYSILRDDIINLRLKPGTFFSIKDICEFYEAGRTPMRDALIRLEQEGMVAFLPQRGTMISRLDLALIDNERFIRKSLEEKVMQDFVAVFSPTIILRLEDTIRRQKEFAAKKDVRGFLASDDEFHSLFYEEVGRLYCWQVIDRECCNYKRLRLLTLLTDEEAIPSVIKEHEAIVSAAAARDVEEVLRWFDIHLGRIRSQERKTAKRFPDLFQDPHGPEKRENHDLERDFLVSIRSRS